MFFLLLLLFLTPINLTYAHTLSTADGSTIYYETAGKSGDPIIFIPGWTMSHVVFEKQITYFSQHYHVIAMDPRGQGLSSTRYPPNDPSKNAYDQHGEDIADLIDALGLKHMILVGWSFGCYDAYAYMRLKGTSNIKAFVCIDAAPKARGGKEDWIAPVTLSSKAELTEQMARRDQFMPEWAQSMVDRSLTDEERNTLVDISLQTPSPIALSLLLDALDADYSPEAILLAESGVPSLNVVPKLRAKSAENWINTHAPDIGLMVLGEKHMMFWEYPEQFNIAVAGFLEHAKTKK